MVNMYIKGENRKENQKDKLFISRYIAVKYNLPAKFLFQLSDKSEMNLVECFAQSERHIDDYSLAIIRHIHLTAREKNVLLIRKTFMSRNTSIDYLQHPSYIA